MGYVWTSLLDLLLHFVFNTVIVFILFLEDVCKCGLYLVELRLHHRALGCHHVSFASKVLLIPSRFLGCLL